MVTQTSKSITTKKRHKQAREQYSLYKFKNPKTNLTYNDFFKNELPDRVYEDIVSYDVVFQCEYSGKKADFKFENKSFQVIGLSNDSDDIKTNTMNMLLDSKGKMTNTHLQPNTQKAVEDNAQITVKPRGMEQSDSKPKLTRAELFKVLAGEQLVKDLDSEIEMSNSRGGKGKLKLDLRHFQ